MPPPTRSQQTRAILIGGLLPIIAFTFVEEYYGTLWGVVAGMVFGIGELLNEWFRNHKVETMTWIGNGLLLGMGGISLLTGEGIWMKLQPAIIEGVMALILLISVILGKPFLVLLAKKQGTFETMPEPARPIIEKGFQKLTFRMSLFLGGHAILATYAALYWSTRAWAILKGVGFTGSFIIYLILEMVWLRKKIKQTLPVTNSEKIGF